MNKKYVLQKPENDKYKNRPCPTWFNDAKLGVFIHWGPYSVPAWAPIASQTMFAFLVKLAEEEGYDIDSINHVAVIMREKYMEYMKQGKPKLAQAILDNVKMSENPYSEWYMNSMETTEATRNYHKQTYGDKSYYEFGPEFEQISKKWDANTWAKLFDEIGVKYVLTTAKHHDGYCLYPSKFKNPKVEKWQTKRDLIGDLKVALESKGIKNCLYYSAGLDWGMGGGIVLDGKMAITYMSTPKELEYVDNQLMEIIDKYQPSMIWEDIGYSDKGNFEKILDHYYDVVPDGVMNDRAQCSLDGVVTRHFDYTTTEYFKPLTIRETPWEICRGIGNSFGYNQLDNENSMSSPNELVHDWADIVSKNGNLMLGIGPMADGTIPEIQKKVVKEFGRWVTIWGDGIFGSRPYTYHKDTLKSGEEVRFVVKDGVLNIIILGGIRGNIEFVNLKIEKGAKITLATGEVLTESFDGKLTLDKVYDEKAVVLCVETNKTSIAS